MLQFQLFELVHVSPVVSRLTGCCTQVDVSPMDLSHTEPIYDFAWLQSKTGSEVMTVSSDGLVLWWDIRMFGEYTAKLAVDKSQEIIESLPIKEKGAEHCQVQSQLVTAGLQALSRCTRVWCAAWWPMAPWCTGTWNGFPVGAILACCMIFMTLT